MAWTIEHRLASRFEQKREQSDSYLVQVGAVLVGLQNGAQLAQRATRTLLQRDLDGVLGRAVLCSEMDDPD